MEKKAFIDQRRLGEAIATPTIAFVREGDINRGGVLHGASALLYLILAVREDAGATEARDRAIEHLKGLVSDKDIGPIFDLGPFWVYTNLTAAIALAKETKAIWSALTEREVKAYDLIMRCFAYVLNFGNADGNDYVSGPSMKGNFCKSWNPNYRLANVTPMLFISSYFGSADAVNEILLSFDYDAMTAELLSFGFFRAHAAFTVEPPILADGSLGTSPKQVMENGGPLYLKFGDSDLAKRLHITDGKPAGQGLGVRTPFVYHGNPLSDVGAIMRDLLAYNYSGGAVVSSYGEYPDGKPKSYILDGTSSPVEGKLGMMREFASGDGGNGTSGPDIRSSCSYTAHDFIMIIAALAAARELGIYDLRAPENADVAALVDVGNADFIYKYEHGYMSYSLSHPYESYEKESDGYFLWKSYWLSGAL